MLGHVVHKIVVLEKNGEIPCLLLLRRQPLAEQLVNAVVHAVMAAFVVDHGITPCGQFGIFHPKFVFRHGLSHAACDVVLKRLFWRLLWV